MQMQHSQTCILPNQNKLITESMKRKVNTDEDNGEVKPHSFFKLMISSTSFSMLRIPGEFARDFQFEHCESVALTVPTGETKRVAVVEEDDKLWFKDGWQEFVEYFSVGYGYFLLFTYYGNSAFRVKIFDLTACEICYQSYARTSSSAELCSCHGNLSSGSASKERCNNENDSDIKDALIDSEDDEMESQEGQLVSKTEQATESFPLGCPSWWRNCALATNRASRINNTIEKVVAAANISIPERPCFIALIKSSNLTSRLLVPAAFAQKHMRKCRNGDLVTVETSDGRQWEIQCHGIKSCFLGKGWTAFMREIGLKAGDVCVFELIDADSYVLKVQVAKKFRKKDAADMGLRAYCTSTRSYLEPPQLGRPKINYDCLVKAAAAARIPLPDSPFFLALIKSNDLRHACLSVPSNFAQEHLITCKKGDLLKIETSDGRQWVIQYYIHKNHSSLGKGWTTLAREICLEVGDICIFKLIDRENYVLKLQVVKKSQIKDPNLLAFCAKPKKYPETTSGCNRWQNVKYDRVIKAVAAAGITLPETPFFVALINSYSLHRCALYVPSNFAREHFICKTGDLVRIETSEERQWVVQYLKGNQSCQLGNGWIVFVREKGLEAGDICLFELLDTENYVLKVQVVRKHQIQDAEVAFLYSSCRDISSRSCLVRPQCFPSATGRGNNSDKEVMLLDSEDHEIKSQEGSKHISNTEEDNGDIPLRSHKQSRINYEGVVKAVAGAGIATPTKPFFVSRMTPRYLRDVHIPLAFAKKHLRITRGYMVKIETCDERRWEIRCNRSKGGCSLGMGWSALAQDVGLEVGDICVFELGNAGIYVLKLQVVKKSQIKDDTNLYA